jgi:hypothetical protein
VDEGMRYAVLTERDNPEKLRVLYPPPLPKDPWGALAPLRETSWGAEIPLVRGDFLTHALHGHIMPLRRTLGLPPQERPRRLPLLETICMERQANRCPMATGDCVPGSTRLPECYVAPMMDETLRRLGTMVGRAWDEGRYVFVVVGREHVVR